MWSGLNAGYQTAMEEETPGLPREAWHDFSGKGGTLTSRMKPQHK